MERPSLGEPPRLDRLPSLIAIPLAEYAAASAEREPKLKLWNACDVVEFLLRVSVMAGVAEFRRAGGLPPDVLSEVRRRIEKPTMGRWWGMAEAIARRLSPATAVLPGLREFVLDVLGPFLAGPAGRPTAESSFLLLRNQLAHGGGVTAAYARRALASWARRFEAVIEQASFLADSTLVAREPDGTCAALRGPSGEASRLNDGTQELLAGHPEGSVLLVREGQFLVLWPMALWGEALLPGGERLAGPPALQVYARTEDAGLQFTPIGANWGCQTVSDQPTFQLFRQIFQVDRSRQAPAAGGLSVAGFEDQILKDADEVVGRSHEVRTLVSLLREMPQGLAWIGGAAGIGKSFTLARAVADVLDAPPHGALVLPFRFKAGDERCSREAFLRFALERLDAWDGLVARDESAGPESDKPLVQLGERLGRLAGGRRLVIVADGLDEIAARDPRFAADVPIALAAPRVLWLCAGREEAGLPEAFRAAGAAEPWPHGLPRMSDADIHEMLLERLGHLRSRLVRADRDEGERVVNGFVGRVAANADGLPIYVRYVVNDVLGGALSPEVSAHLPPSLAAYHERILERCEIGDLRQVLPPLVGTLAVAREPLTAPALGDLLARRHVVERNERGLELVQLALSAIGAMVRLLPTPEGEDGFALFHHSFREHVLTSPRTRMVVETARQALAEAARTPGRSSDFPAAGYLYRQGVLHLVEAARASQAVHMLSDFAYLMARLQTLRPGGAEGVARDWQQVLETGVTFGPESRLWEAFFRERGHLLCRGSAGWPSYRILLQLAVEHADDSPVTRQAEAWLAAGLCDWLWLRNPRRVPHAAPDPCLRVLEGHTEFVWGAATLADGRVLSWSGDHSLRLWTPDGSPLATLAGHTATVSGGRALDDGRILSWSRDNTLRLWTAEGNPLATLAGHTAAVVGTAAAADGLILSWSEDHTLRLWAADGGLFATLAGHTDVVSDATVLASGRILSWSWDHTLRLWTARGEPIATLAGHTDWISRALVLADDRILSWAWGDRTLRLWAADGRLLAALPGHLDTVSGAAALRDGRLLSWSWDHTLRLWSAEGLPLSTLEGHSGGVVGAAVMEDGRILSWSEDHRLRLWNAEGHPLAILAGHTDKVTGAMVLVDGRILSWSRDHTLRLWSAEGAPLAVLNGHAHNVSGVLAFADGRILSWSEDLTLRPWTADGAPIGVFAGHTGWIKSALILADGRVLSWSGDHTLRLWAPEGSSPEVLTGHTRWVEGVTVLPDGRVLSWSGDRTLRLWTEDGHPLATLAGHTRWVEDAMVLPAGRILSWSGDHTLRLWTPEGDPIATLEGHADTVRGAMALADGRILSWSWDYTLRLWTPAGQPLAVLAGHAGYVRGAMLLPDGRILSWSWDGTLRIWSPEGQPLTTLSGHRDVVRGAMVLADGRVLSWSEDHTLRLWTGAGRRIAALSGHASRVTGAAELPDGRILSWADDATLRLWTSEGGRHSTLVGHSGDVQGATVLPDGRILTWSRGGTLRLWTTEWRSDGQWRTEDAPGPILAAYLSSAGRAGLVQHGVPVRHDPGRILVAGAEWHSTARPEPRAYLADGTVVVSLESGHLFCLKLHRGAPRASAAEALALTAARGSRDGRALEEQ